MTTKAGSVFDRETKGAEWFDQETQGAKWFDREFDSPESAAPGGDDVMPYVGGGYSPTS